MSESISLPSPSSGLQNQNKQIRDYLSLIFEPGDVFEIRALKPYTSFGYFDDIDIAAEKAAMLDNLQIYQGIYFTLNPVNPGLLARKKNRIEKAAPGEITTSDNDILHRRWLYVDIDPKRPSGISATDEEIHEAELVINRIRGYLSEMGFSEPIYADSGNGRHLLYKIDLPNTHESTELIKSVLTTLDGIFSTSSCDVDVSVSNPARICKLYGTLSRKGDNLPDRPHRRSRIIITPDVIITTPIEILQTVANISKEPETIPQQKKQTPNSDKMASEYLDEWGLSYTVKTDGPEVLCILDECPFCGDKKTSYTSQPFGGGPITFKCHHANSCVGTSKNSWKLLHAKMDPGYNPEREYSTKEKSNPQKKTGPIEKDEEEPIRHLPFFEKSDTLYLTCITPDERYQYAHLEGREIIFTGQELDSMGMLTVPPQLPIHQDRGTTVYVVGLPRTDLLSKSVSMSPDDLYTRMRTHFHKYTDAPEIEYEVFVYFCLYSWFYPKCGTAPYLRFIADTGKGKSRFLKVTSDLCFYPIKASGSSSLSGIMRFKEKWNGTLLIDESDLKGDQADPLIKYLNLGFEKDNFFMLTDKNDVSKSQVFDPFGPKVIAMRQPFRDVATEGRCLSFSPNETLREDIPSELPKAYYSEVADLRALISRFVMEHWQEISEDDMISCTGMAIEPRLKQMARPLSIILRLFPDGEDRFKQYLQVRQVEIKQTRAESWEGSIFNYILALATGEEDVLMDPEFGRYYQDGTIQAVTPKMLEEPFRAKAKAITTAMLGIGMDVKQKRIYVQTKDGLKSKKVRPFLVPNEQKWHEMTQRYFNNVNCDSIPPCPDCLKGPEYSTRQAKISLDDRSPAPVESVPRVPLVPDTRETPTGVNPVETPSFHLEDLKVGVNVGLHHVSGTTGTSGTEHTHFSCVTDWITYQGFPTDLDVTKYSIIPKERRKGIVCACKGCSDEFPLYWIDGFHQICQKCFNELQSILKQEKEAHL